MTDKKTIGKEIRVLPIPGRALQYESTESTMSVFSSPEHGFLIGPENYALGPVVQWILEGPIDRNILPFFFYGPSGCGKTHLLSGLAESWTKKHRKGTLSKKNVSNAVFMSAIDFARYLSEAIETKTTEDFRKRFRNTDLLVLDDIDRITDKLWILDELHHTLDELEINGGTLVLSSSTSPFFLKQISDPLRARFLGGTVLPILSPGESVRKYFLKNIANAYHINLSETTLQFIIEKLPYTIPRLHGCFTQIVFESSANNELLDDVKIKSYIRTHLNETFPGIDSVAKKVAKHFSLKLIDLKGKSRAKAIALARSIAVYLALQKTGKTVKEIAEYFGKRDVSTIRYLIDKVDNELTSDSILRQHIALLSQD